MTSNCDLAIAKQCGLLIQSYNGGKMSNLQKLLSCQKDLFTLPNKLHYLNCAYMSPLSQKVQEAGIVGVGVKGNPSQISPEDFFEQSNQLRDYFARIINVDANKVALIPSVSYGVNTAVANIKATAGQNIIILSEQFPSNVYPWYRFRDNGVEIRTISAPNSIKNRAKEWNSRILEAIDSNTAVVAMPQVHWTDGTLFDLESIGTRAREVGAVFIIDAIQSVGAYPFDNSKIRADAVIVANYKHLMGPYGIGYAYYGEYFDNGKPLEDNWLSRKGSEDFGRLIDYQDEYTAGAARFDMGGRANPILQAMAVAALEQVLDFGVDNIQNYCQNLTKPYIKQIQELGFSIENENWRGAHLFGIYLPDNIDLNSLKNTLLNKNISVSVRGAAIRVSPNIYNDEADMQALLDALELVIRP